MSFQDALYSLEVGKGRRWVQWGALVVGFIFLGLLYILMLFRGFDNPAAMDSAQLARQLATGQGYTTKVIRPSALRVFANHYSTPAMVAQKNPPKINVFSMPDITNAPVYPAVLSVIFRVSGVNFEPTAAELGKSQLYAPERLIVFFSQFCIFLTAGALYFWAWRMFDSRVALVATIAFVGCDLIWQFSLSGLSTSWVMLLMTLMGAALHESLIAEEEDRSMAVWGWSIASAVFLVLIILSKLSLAWLLFPYAALVLVGLRRMVFPPLVAILIVLLGITPWFVRNYQVCGNPFGTGIAKVAEFGTVKEASGDRSYFQTSSWPVKHAMHKTYEGFGHAMSEFFPMLGSSAVILLFAAALFHRFKRRRTQWMRWFLVWCGIAVVFGSSLLRGEPKPTDDENNLILLFPGMAAVGAAFFYVLLDRLDIGLQIVRYIVVTFFLGICAVPLVIALLPPGPSAYHYPPYFPPMVRYISHLLEPNELMVSDIATATAWYGGRTSLWMPTTLKEFYEINDSIQTASGMLLTPESWDSSLYKIDKGPSQDWAPLIRRQGLPTGFPLTSYTPMPPLDNEYLFFSDRRRW